MDDVNGMHARRIAALEVAVNRSACYARAEMGKSASQSWKNVAFRVPADKHAEIKQRAALDGMPMCSYVRRLVYRDLRADENRTATNT